jgi:hypothetical protein
MLSEDRSNEEVLDEAYRKYADSDPFMPITHFIDHATMGAEALVALGRGDKVKEWISHHRARSYKAPVAGLAMPADWRQALGRRECHGDWIQLFDAELAARPFQEVLAEWVPRFAHEVGAFLFHGLIRTAHATRALDHRDTAERRIELSRGLALWAIGVKSAPAPRPTEAMESSASESDILNFARFGAAAFISDPNVPKLHLVTGPMAYMLLAHYLDKDAHHIARLSFSKTHCMVAKQFKALKPQVYAEPNVILDHDRLEAIAAQSDAHPIKLTDAALRGHKLTQDDIFLKAAAKALDIHSLRALLGIAKAMVQRHVA